MESILLLAHTEPDGTLPKPALAALTTVKSLAGSLPGAAWSVGLVGTGVQGAANQLADCGAARVLGAVAPEFGISRYATDAAAAEALCRAAGATLVVAPATTRWNRTLAGVAQRLGGRIDSHVAGLSGADGQVSLTRWYYRQRMEAVVLRTSRPWLILLEPGAAEPWSGSPGSVPVEAVPVALGDAHRRTTVTGVRTPAADRQTIRPDASLLFVAGAGWTKTQPDGHPHADEAEQLILDFLAQAKASLGSTKSLVDLSGEGQAVLKFMTHLNQVGQTGSTPRHPKGLATCCHGEEPHTVGWRFITERRAVNLNPNCSWAQGKADVLYVADAFAVMRRVNALLAARGA